MDVAKFGSLTLSSAEADLFWARVDRTAPAPACWPWIGHRNADGYGKLKIRGRTLIAHRVAFALSRNVGVIDACVLHSCDNPACCNPAHLRMGTNAENQAEKVAKGRQAKGDVHGARRHPNTRPRGSEHGRARLTEDNVREIRRRHAAGKTIASLAARYGVATKTVWFIVHRKTWLHVGDG